MVSSDHAPAVVSAPRDASDRGLLALVAPLVDLARRSWRETTVHSFERTRLVRADVDALGASLARALDARLLHILRPTLALELQVARLRDPESNISPAARFDAFVARIAEPAAALALLREYPVLARQVATVIDTWLAASTEMITRLVADASALLRARLLPLGGTLVATDIGRGDTHCGGRSVTVVTWDDGSKLVYKPRSLAVDVHFGELLSWVNGHRVVPELRAPRVSDFGTHGWMEFVEARACASADDVARFYARQGALLALAHVLDGVDLHGENVIACGEHPVLIDLEALLHPRVDESERSGDAAVSSMRESVLRVGLLPDPSSDGGYDGSGLGSGEGTWKVAMPVWTGHGTDELRVDRRLVPANPTAHRPVLDGHPISALAHRATLTRAFDATLSLVSRERGALLAPGGPVARFARDQVRAILRPTELYALLLRETYHPDLLRDARDRDRAFDRLSLGTEGQPWLARAMHAERYDLWRGDIPYFTVRATSRDLVTSTGEVIEHFFPESAMTSVARKIDALDEDERARQRWFVDSALTALGSAGDAERLREKIYAPVAAGAADTETSLVSTACVLGDRLATLALRRGAAVDWLGLAYRNERWEVVPVGASLGDGKLGIALFLAMLGQAASEPSYTRLADAALSSALRDAPSPPHAARIGAFEGAAGSLFVLAHLGALWGDTTTERMVPALDVIEAGVASDLELDVIGGAAGAIRALLAVAIGSGVGRAAELAVACGDRLLARAENVGDGIGWCIPGSTRPLAGYAHGTSGIAVSLLALTAYTGEGRFAAAAHRAFVFERSLLCRETRNWRDLRFAPGDGADSAGESVAWCHGAPGIGLARVHALRATGDASLAEDLAIAVKTTRERGFGASHCLCHGDLGNLELLVADAEHRGDPVASDHARRLASTIAASVRVRPLCGNPHRIETPDLLSGLAGIGYGLLRIANPRGVPSVLTLDPPRESR